MLAYEGCKENKKIKNKINKNNKKAIKKRLEE